MKHKNSTMIFVLLLALFLPRMMPAQWQFSAQADAGEHNASEGFYLRTGAVAEYRYAGTRLGAALQFDLLGNVPKVWSGLNLHLNQELKIRDFPFALGAFFLYKPYSELQYENNWGLLAQTDYRHFHFMLGNGFRAFRLTRQAIQSFPEDAGTVIRENWNLIYRIGYNLKSEECTWNAGLAVTNMDRFLMNQETNPMLLLHGNLELVSDLDLFAEFWYKQAGVFNISANYFGFFFRMGAIWEL
ncbi:MAG: hypothetical protein PHT46_04155 [Candidatus Marinimicrobia bacterium]|nr:hypothetical protein [Candidatus Neomarinimicrobiota bacterium]